ncbi:MAG: NAD(P)H-dependent amine dehydrogenase family protein [Jatrophihabitans sp.]|uniref:NAD(P)H-dependent amine dehydrogenase family protein n=1 Tax=Jatrophihabitans sp. TaxID=1932789 RepID=UPI003F80A0E7
MTLRVVEWSTGNAGRAAIAGIDARPELELVGVYVSNPDKVGKDAGELAGLGRTLGVTATDDVEALLALKPDCIVHTAMADNRLTEALDDLRRMLEAGINVVSSGPVFLQYPYGVVPDEMIKPLEQAAEQGGASLWVNGIDPGWANDWLPLVVTSASERIDEVRCFEICDYSTYNQRDVVMDIMGFGKPLDETPMLLLPGVLTMAWGSVVRQLAAALDVSLDEITETVQRVPAPETFDIACGRIEQGTAAALRFEVLGMRGGHPVVALEHVTRLRPDLAPDWPQPAGQSCYRVKVTGEPTYTVDLQFMGEDGDHNTGGLKGTSMRLVNAVEAVVAARPGLLTALDLPLVTGRGLVR